MRYSDVVANLKRLTLFAIALSAFVPASPASAVDSTVNVAVCGAGASAQLAISSPPSDSIVNQPNVDITGTVQNASQIDVLIDGNYNSTVPLNVNQTNFTVPVQLTAGTHTVALTANDVCHTQDATASVVITYQPQTNPGSGDETPTTINNSDGGVTIGDDPVTSDDNSRTSLDTWPVIGPLVRFGHDLAIALDFEVSGQPGALWRSMVRFSFIVLGLSTVIFGNIALSVWGWTHGPLTARTRWGIRAFGVILLVIAFAI